MWWWRYWKYPPPSLRALLDIYLLDNITEESKCVVTIYLLLDIMSSFPNKQNSTIESFYRLFSISFNQLTLIQEFWNIDRKNFEGFLTSASPNHCQTFVLATYKNYSSLNKSWWAQLALIYINRMNPMLFADSDILLHLSVLIYNRYMVEACHLLRQHSNNLNRKDFLKYTSEMCQDMGLLEDFLKLPLKDTEQECLVRILQSSSSVQYHEILLAHHLQHVSYNPALKLSQTLQMNHMNNYDSLLQERYMARNSLLAQCGKRIPRVEQKVTIQRAKPSSLNIHSSRGCYTQRDTLTSKVNSKEK